MYSTHNINVRWWQDLSFKKIALALRVDCLHLFWFSLLQVSFNQLLVYSLLHHVIYLLFLLHSFLSFCNKYVLVNPYKTPVKSPKNTSLNLHFYTNTSEEPIFYNISCIQLFKTVVLFHHHLRVNMLVYAYFNTLLTSGCSSSFSKSTGDFKYDHHVTSDYHTSMTKCRVLS